MIQGTEKAYPYAIMRLTLKYLGRGHKGGVCYAGVDYMYNSRAQLSPLYDSIKIQMHEAGVRQALRFVNEVLVG